MPITVDIMENELLREMYEQYCYAIYRKEYKEGYEKGYEEGFRQGVVEGAAKLFLRMLQGRFGPLPEEAVARVRQAPLEQIEAWADRFWEGQSVDEVCAS